MTLGKHICKTLKEIRLQVAKANDIPYAPTECSHKGDCAGTCPKCEQELRYIEHQLDLRQAMGKAVSLVGISMGLTALSSCTLFSIFRPTAGAVERNPHEQLDGILPNEIDSTSVDDTQKNTAADGKREAKSLVAKEDTTKAELVFGEIVEQQPSFPGGNKALLKFIDDNIQYSREMEEICVSDRAIVSFTIERDGSVTNAKVVKSLHPLFDKEALRIVGLMPKWSPAKENGEIKKVTYNLPISFKLK